MTKLTIDGEIREIDFKCFDCNEIISQSDVIRCQEVNHIILIRSKSK